MAEVMRALVGELRERRMAAFRMLMTHLQTRLEAALARRLVRRARPSLTLNVPKDDGNIFSLHDVPVETGIRAVSLDFFDTLVFRRNLTLAEVRRKTAHIAADIVPGDRQVIFRKVYGARGFQSEAIKRSMIRRGDGNEPRLRDIFVRALKAIVPDPDTRDRLARRLVAIETEIELRNLMPNEEALPLLRALKATGLIVAVTSDMYLTEREMARVVEHMGFAPYVDHLFVSAEVGVTKNSGELFPVVAHKLGLDPSEILHVGDNWHNDVVMARTKGFRALHFISPDQHTEDRVRNLETSIPRSAERRKAEYRHTYGFADPGVLDSLDRIIDEVIGPACGLFAADALMAAERRGSSNIYFLTRDGTIFLDIARNALSKIPALFGGRAKLSPLATSRSNGSLLRTFRLDLNDLIHNTTYLMQAPFSLRLMFRLYELTTSDFSGCSAEIRHRIDSLSNKVDEKPFRDLMRMSDFRAALKAGLDQRRGEVVAYLAQEGVLTARAPVFVDIGYSGTWAKQLSFLAEYQEVEGKAFPNCEFRFFASNRFFEGNLAELHSSIDMVPGFMLDHRDPGCLRASLNFSWLEPFLVDPTLGTFHGYRQADRLEPRFDESPYTSEEKAILEMRRERIVERGTEVIDSLLRHPGDLCILRDLVRERMVKLADRPCISEVKAINGLIHQRGMKDVAHQPIARRFYPNRLGAKLAYLKDHDYWVQGSMALSGLGVVSPLMALHPRLNPLSANEATR